MAPSSTTLFIAGLFWHAFSVISPALPVHVRRGWQSACWQEMPSARFGQPCYMACSTDATCEACQAEQKSLRVHCPMVCAGGSLTGKSVL